MDGSVLARPDTDAADSSAEAVDAGVVDQTERALGEELPAVAMSDEELAALQNDEPMVVTASRIRRPSSFAQSAAVDVIDRGQLERSGATNMADVVAGL